MSFSRAAAETGWALEAAVLGGGSERQHYRFVVVGYVVMPEHIHLLISEPEKGNPSRVLQAVKQGFARRVLRKR